MEQKIREAVIIAGGRGSRLMPLTADIPKTLVMVDGKPILKRVIGWLKYYGIEHLIIGVAYKGEKVAEYMKENSNFGLDVHISKHSLEGDTAEAFRLAISRYSTEDDFIAMNSDELTNMNLYDFEKIHEKKKPLVTMALAPLHCRFSLTELNDNMVTSFEYGKKILSLPVSIGIYEFNKGIMDYVPGQGSIEQETFKKLVAQNRVAGYLLKDSEEWITINTQKDIDESQKSLSSWKTLDFMKLV